MDISSTNNFNKDLNMPELEWYEETAPISDEAWDMLKPTIRNDKLDIKLLNKPTQRRKDER